MALPPVPDAGTLGMRVLNVSTGAHVALYRLTRGKVGGRFGKVTMLLLEHVGRRSGQERTTPLLYGRDGERLILIASAGGRDRAPAWFLNIRDAGRATVQVGNERQRVAVRVAEGEERERLWRRMAEVWPDYDAYQSRTERQIPVVVLEPA